MIHADLTGSSLSVVDNLLNEWDDLCETQRQTLLLLRGAQQSSKSGRAHKTINWIADQIGVGPRAITRSISKLVKMRVVTRTFRGRKGSLYEVHADIMGLDPRRLKSPYT